MNNLSLIYIPKIKPTAHVRLICFSYAGGNASTYMSWQNYLDPDVELAVVQLPGRGIRLTETPLQTMTELVKAIFLALEKLSPKPFIFYGHSMGARVAYELTLMLGYLQRRLPIHFIASGSVAPCIERTKENTYHLPDEDFIKKIGELNGSSTEVLANNEIMQMLLPALRADFKIIETYCNKSQVIIPTKISVLAGDEEEVEPADVEAWLKLFASNTGIHWISGDHFFVDKNRSDVLQVLNNLLEEHLVGTIKA
ncbi:MAG: alpha/beta fold hydrolase [Pseudomonadota bacterium]